MEQQIDKKELIAILEELHPEIDVATCTTFVTDGILDSFDLISLISEIAEVFDVVITANYILAEHFDSLESLVALIEKIKRDA